MAKRFIDTDLFKKQFIRHLKPAYKLFWVYVTTDCNHAGIWECDFEVAKMRLGQKIEKDAALKHFGDKVVEIEKGAKWFIPSFIEFQYGEISKKNKAHKGIIALLDKYKLWSFLKLPKPLGSPLEGAKVMVMEEDMDNSIPKAENPLGMEFVKKIANEAWADQLWRESICMGSSITEPDLKKWMAQFNSSICNDTFPDFSQSKYKKLFRGFLNKEKQKGVTVSGVSPDQPQLPKRLQSLNTAS